MASAAPPAAGSSALDAKSFVAAALSDLSGSCECPTLFRGGTCRACENTNAAVAAPGSSGMAPDKAVKREEPAAAAAPLASPQARTSKPHGFAARAGAGLAPPVNQPPAKAQIPQSDHRGVSSNGEKWVAKISLNGQNKHIGAFDFEEEAARAFDAEARKHFDEETLPQQGQYGGFNFPAPDEEEEEEAESTTAPSGKADAPTLTKPKPREEPAAPVKPVPDAAPKQASSGNPQSAFRGVSWYKANSKWEAYVFINGKKKSCGKHVNEEDAARAFDAEARKHYDNETLPRNARGAQGFNFPAPEEESEEESEEEEVKKTSSYRGVRWDKKCRKWNATGMFAGKSKRLGSFEDEEEAAHAYNAEARKHYTDETLPMQNAYGGFNFAAPDEEEEEDAAPEQVNSSAYRGVSWGKQKEKWRACVYLSGKTKSLGYFDEEEEAARAFDAAARKHYTEKTLPRNSRGAQGFNFPLASSSLVRAPTKTKAKAKAAAPSASAVVGMMLRKEFVVAEDDTVAAGSESLQCFDGEITGAYHHGSSFLVRYEDCSDEVMKADEALRCVKLFTLQVGSWVEATSGLPVSWEGKAEVIAKAQGWGKHGGAKLTVQTLDTAEEISAREQQVTLVTAPTKEEQLGAERERRKKKRDKKRELQLPADQEKEPASAESQGAEANAALPSAARRQKSVTQKSKYRGVSGLHGKWKAAISIKGKTIQLGAFDDEEEASRAYDTEARKHYDEKTLPRQGSFGGFNFPAPEISRASKEEENAEQPAREDIYLANEDPAAKRRKTEAAAPAAAAPAAAAAPVAAAPAPASAVVVPATLTALAAALYCNEQQLIAMPAAEVTEGFNWLQIPAGPSRWQLVSLIRAAQP